MNTSERSRLDALLDLLADEVADRLRGRSSADAAGRNEPGVDRTPDGETVTQPGGLIDGQRAAARAQPVTAAAMEDGGPNTAELVRHPIPAEAQTVEVDLPERGDLAPGVETSSAAAVADAAPMPPQPPGHTAFLLGRLLLGLFVVVVLINIPYNRHGTALARSIPGSAALVIRNGLVVKESDKPDIYVYQDGRFRWISSLDAFQHYGFQWAQVRVVEPGFLANFETGSPLHVLLKCPASPHIYRLEGGQKRWIVDIQTLESEGHQWSDVQMVDCGYLRSLPAGETIPPGRGPAPEP